MTLDICICIYMRLCMSIDMSKYYISFDYYLWKQRLIERG